MQTDQYIAWLKQGKTFEDVREDLKAKGFTEEEISQYVRILDNTIQHRAVAGETRHHRRSLFFAGLTVGLLGIGLTFYTYMTGGGTVFIAYGAILAGGGMMFYSKKR